MEKTPYLAVDMHLHSTYSDGTCSPREICRRAKELGIRALVLTDHDTLNGLKDMENACREYDLETMTGVELSTKWQGKTIHILGYGLDPENCELNKKLLLWQKQRLDRNIKIVERLSAGGIDISMKHLEERYPDAVFTRANIASVLYDRGVISSVEEAFKTLLHKNGPYYVSLERITPMEAIEILRNAKAAPVFAHPVLTRMCEQQLDLFTGELREAGLAGMEGLYSGYTVQNREQIKRLAKKYDLLITGGSDFHGDNKPQIRIGSGKGELFVPYSCFSGIKERLGS